MKQNEDQADISQYQSHLKYSSTKENIFVINNIMILLVKCYNVLVMCLEHLSDIVGCHLYF